MPQDAFTIKYVASELDSALKGGKISKIIQPSKDSLLFFIYTRNGTVKLEICLSAKGCRLNLTEDDPPAPQIAPGFCMLLRKHLQNAQIESVRRVDGERIVYFDLICTSEFELQKMRLYAELMGKYSNAVLTLNGIILGALKTTAIGDNTERVLFSGVKYELPKPQDKTDPENVGELSAALENISGDAAKFISDRVKGIAYATALDIVETYGEKPTAKQVNSYICGGQTEPCVTFLNGEPDDFKARSSSRDKTVYDSVLRAQTAYYAYVTRKQSFLSLKTRLSSALNSAIKKLEKRLSIINSKLLDCRDMDTIKLKGELITANIYAVKRGMDGFEAVNYYDENGGKIKIALDRTLSPSENAQKYYKRYAKLKRTQETVTAQRQEATEALDYLNSINSHICAAESVLDLAETEEELKGLGILKAAKNEKKKPAALPFRTYEIGGFKVLAGRNNLQNDRLLKNLSPQDMWLHTQGYHSSHVAVLCGGAVVPDGVIKAAAESCAYYSDGRAGNKIPVDYTRRKFVKKPPKFAAGFVIYTDYKTALADPDAHEDMRIDDER